MPVSKKRKKVKKKKKQGLFLVSQEYVTPATIENYESLFRMSTTKETLEITSIEDTDDIKVVSETHHVKNGIPSIVYKYECNNELYEVDFIDKYYDALGQEPSHYNAWLVKDRKDVFVTKVLPEQHHLLKEDKCKTVLKLYLEKRACN